LLAIGDDTIFDNGQLISPVPQVMLGLPSPMASEGRVLVVGESLAAFQPMGLVLSRAGFREVTAVAAASYIAAPPSATFDVALLVCSGRLRADESLLQRIVRAKLRCVVLLRGPGTGRERAGWLERGADDCVGFPCDGDELIARLRVHLRHRPQPRVDTPWRAGELVFFPGEQRAERRGRPLLLTTFEYALLAALAEHAGRPLRREQLLEIAHGSAEVAFERAIDVQVSRLRAKLGDHSRHPQILKTVRGVGYMLALPNEPDAS
jgi:DNA-binding response OmpR family regulator